MVKKIKNQEAWDIAKKRHRLSNEVIQMAKELGLNPKKFGSLDNHKQEPWKEPLPDFIRTLYMKRFGHLPHRTALGPDSTQQEKESLMHPDAQTFGKK